MCLILIGQIRISPGSLQGDAYWLVAAEECIYVGLEFLRFEALWEAWKLTGELCGNRGRPWIAEHPEPLLGLFPSNVAAGTGRMCLSRPWAHLATEPNRGLSPRVVLVHIVASEKFPRGTVAA